VQRPALPRALEREVLVEAGHRCAIPTCGQTPVEIAHIVPFSDVRQHTFDNLIALCPTCHSRFDGGQIDRVAMRCYKTNLSLLSNRYGEMERRVIQHFVDHPELSEIMLSVAVYFLISYLIKDGLLCDPESDDVFSYLDSDDRRYVLTEAGVAFCGKLRAAQQIQ
jgi:hypothetical protein